MKISNLTLIVIVSVESQCVGGRVKTKQLLLQTPLCAKFSWFGLISSCILYPDLTNIVLFCCSVFVPQDGLESFVSM